LSEAGALWRDFAVKKTSRERLFASTLLAGVASLGVPVATGVVAMSLAPDAAAQDYTNANLTGTIVDENGGPVAGATVAVTSDAQGFTRSSTTNANGEFRVPQIPQGSYTVVVTANGYSTTTSRDVRVQVGTANAYQIEMAAAGTGDEIVVTATRQVEFQQTTTGTSIDVSELSRREPIARNITGLILLTPSAIPSDTAFGLASGQSLAPASISGATGAENAFFINGLNTTNFINGLGGATVPFDFYQTVEVKTGGYQAEFGRAVGGVVNAVTKSGSNEFSGGLHYNFAPNDLLEDRPNALFRQYSMYDSEQTSAVAELGGPILRDHLFFYGLYEHRDIEQQTASTGGVVNRTTQDDPFWGVKIDAFVTDDHHLEYTFWDTTATIDGTQFEFDPDTNIVDPTPILTTETAQGGENWVARYTGALTDWLTVSAAVGNSQTDASATNSLSTVPLIQDLGGFDPTCSASAPCFVSGSNPTAATTFPFSSERDFYRADVDVFFNLLGEHHVRFGLDHEDTIMNQQSVRNGGTPGNGFLDGGNVTLRFTGPTGTASIGIPEANQDFIRRRMFISGGGFEGETDAIYIQDTWDVTDRLNLSLGWRRDQYSVANPVGDTFVEFDDEQAIRAGFSYDVFGDRSGRLYGFYGRYYLPVPSNTAFRAAAPAIDLDENFYPLAGPGGAITQADIDAILAGNFAGFQQAGGGTSNATCPVGVITISPSGQPNCVVRNNGTAPDVDSVVARNLGSTYEDEFLIGYETQLNSDWTAGVSLTYRDLGRVSEDSKIDRGILAYCAAQGYNLATECGDTSANPGTQPYADSSFTYFIINPGEDAHVILPHGIGPGNTITDVTLTAEQLGFPEVRREYLGLVFSLERPFDGTWGMNASYTLSKSEGNFEGALQSDVGQVDPGITEDYDFLAFIPGHYGLLPNHRAHSLKVRGSYALTENLLVGGNVSVTSPRHYGCIGSAAGFADGDVADDSYGVPADARICNGVVVDRGSVFDTDWIYNTDLSIRYDLPQSIFSFGTFTLRADVFNLFNEQAIQEANESGELGAGIPDPDYQAPIAFQTPRSFRFGIDWTF
jgi:hypothetical protein